MATSFTIQEKELPVDPCQMLLCHRSALGAGNGVLVEWFVNPVYLETLLEGRTVRGDNGSEFNTANELLEALEQGPYCHWKINLLPHDVAFRVWMQEIDSDNNRQAEIRSRLEPKIRAEISAELAREPKPETFTKQQIDAAIQYGRDLASLSHKDFSPVRRGKALFSPYQIEYIRLSLQAVVDGLITEFRVPDATSFSFHGEYYEFVADRYAKDRAATLAQTRARNVARDLKIDLEDRESLQAA